MVNQNDEYICDDDSGDEYDQIQFIKNIINTDKKVQIYVDGKCIYESYNVPNPYN